MARRSRRRRRSRLRRVARRVSVVARGLGGAAKLARHLVPMLRDFMAASVCSCTYCLETDFVVDLLGLGRHPADYECARRLALRLDDFCITPVTGYELRRLGVRVAIPTCRPPLAGLVAAVVEAIAYIVAHGVTSENTARDVLLVSIARRVATHLVVGDQRQCGRAVRKGLQCIRYKGRGICP